MDWNLRAEVSDPTQVPSLGVAVAAIDQFSQLTRRWLDTRPEVLRIAFGAVLIRPVASREEAYALIAQEVPGLRLDTPGCADLLYQINRPRESQVQPGLRVNRLAKWAAVQGTLAQFSLSTAAPAISMRAVHIFERLELDMNTAAERSEVLPADGLGALFHELVGLGLEVAREGDIP